MVRATLAGALLLASATHASDNEVKIFAKDVCIPTTVQVTITTTLFKDWTATDWNVVQTSAAAQVGGYGKPGDGSPHDGAGHGWNDAGKPTASGSSPSHGHGGWLGYASSAVANAASGVKSQWYGDNHGDGQDWGYGPPATSSSHTAGTDYKHSATPDYEHSHGSGSEHTAGPYGPPSATPSHPNGGEHEGYGNDRDDGYESGGHGQSGSKSPPAHGHTTSSILMPVGPSHSFPSMSGPHWINSSIASASASSSSFSAVISSRSTSRSSSRTSIPSGSSSGTQSATSNTSKTSSSLSQSSGLSSSSNSVSASGLSSSLSSSRPSSSSPSSSNGSVSSSSASASSQSSSLTTSASSVISSSTVVSSPSSSLINSSSASSSAPSSSSSVYSSSSSISSSASSSSSVSITSSLSLSSSLTSSAISSSSSAPPVCVANGIPGSCSASSPCSGGLSCGVDGVCRTCQAYNQVINGGFASGQLFPWTSDVDALVGTGNVISDPAAPDGDGYVYQAIVASGGSGTATVSHPGIYIRGGSTVFCSAFGKVVGLSSATYTISIDGQTCATGCISPGLGFKQFSGQLTLTGDVHVVTVTLNSGSIAATMNLDAINVVPIAGAEYNAECVDPPSGLVLSAPVPQNCDYRGFSDNYCSSGDNNIQMGAVCGARILDPVGPFAAPLFSTNPNNFIDCLNTCANNQYCSVFSFQRDSGGNTCYLYQNDNTDDNGNVIGNPVFNPAYDVLSVRGYKTGQFCQSDDLSTNTCTAPGCTTFH